MLRGTTRICWLSILAVPCALFAQRPAPSASASPEDETIIVATNKGEPIAGTENSRAGQAYRNIAQRLRGEEVPFLDLTPESNDRWFHEYVLAYTNASTLIEEGFKDAEDLDGLFSGYEPEEHAYRPRQGHWAYQHKDGDG